MVQSKGKKSSVNFKYYALENWLLSLTSNRLSSTAWHFPAKASLESLGLYGMRCKLCRRGRQEGRVVPLLYFILYYCCPVNFKTAEKMGLMVKCTPERGQKCSLFHLMVKCTPIIVELPSAYRGCKPLICSNKQFSLLFRKSSMKTQSHLQYRVKRLNSIVSAWNLIGRKILKGK